MIENIKKWLANHYEINEDEVKSFFSNENVTGFLIIWTIFEQKLFDGFLRYNDLKSYSNENTQKWNDKLETEFCYFHERYQDDDIYRMLVHEENRTEILKILTAKNNKVVINDKLLFLIYVVYRYRNNIFHGNKGVESWLNYTTQIEKCVNVMIQLLKN